MDDGGSGVRIVVVTGLSGAGKSSALRALEDQGYEAIDNLPVRLLNQIASGDPEPGPPLLAIGIDARTRGFDADAVLRWIAATRGQAGMAITLLYLDCADEVLTRRFTETRRRHPMAIDRPVADGVVHERSLLAALRDQSDVVVDTTDLSLTALRQEMAARFAPDRIGQTVISVVSFSYKHGLPREADVVIDVRFLSNPYWNPDLRTLTGQDGPVARHVAADPAWQPFFDRVCGLFEMLIPRYLREGKSYLTIAFGCTGGRHRSVFVAEEIARHLRGAGFSSVVRHRDLAV